MEHMPSLDNIMTYAACFYGTLGLQWLLLRRFSGTNTPTRISDNQDDLDYIVSHSRRLEHKLSDYITAPSDIGPLAQTWKDKPQHVVYDLVTEIKRLRSVLQSLRTEQIDPNAWGIKCIEDHNAIIDEALKTAQ